MELKKEKVVKITDLGNSLYFKIRLFNAMEGLDAMERIRAEQAKGFFSIKGALSELLPLCVPLDSTGTKQISTSFSLNDAGALFQNPLAIVELGFAVLEFQEVFIQDSKIFQKYVQGLKDLFNIKTLESETK